MILTLNPSLIAKVMKYDYVDPSYKAYFAMGLTHVICRGIQSFVARTFISCQTRMIKLKPVRFPVRILMLLEILRFVESLEAGMTITKHSLYFRFNCC